MIGLRLSQTKGLFFDRPAVLRATNRAERRVFSRFGAFVRRGARSSIRKRRATSRPGSPPSSHTGLLRKNIFFVYEPARSSVVIGPIRLNSGTEAPSVLEHGGTVTLRDRRRRRQRRIRYLSRPYMGPAFQRELPKLSTMWRDSIR